MDVSPDKQNIDQVFSHTRYLIDFYQREYKWGDEEVRTLLDDIFHKFNLAYKPGLEPGQKSASHYPWYYLNTYVTNKVEGELFLVDGQQRLTTLTLLLISLHDRCTRADLEELGNWISQKIVSYGGEGRTFWMGANRREATLSALFKGHPPTIDPREDLTGANMVDNYDIVSKYLDAQLRTEHRLQTFVYYFMRRLVLVRLDVQQDDVAMVFEVINDRGIGLKAHEILKGKLLGRIAKSEVAALNDIWEREITPLDADGRADEFFGTYFKSRFADTRTESHKFEGDYHRTIYEPRYNKELGFKADDRPHEAVGRIRSFVRHELPYASGLYRRMLALASNTENEFAHAYYNGLNDMDAQVMLVMAACERGDEAEERKIQALTREFDRFYVLLQLNKAYDSNQFADALYRVRGELVRADPEAYREVFEKELFRLVGQRRNADVSEPLSYAYFLDLGYSDFNRRFLRYLLARVEVFLSDGIGRELQDSLRNLVRNTGPVNGYHVEHILARNDENLVLFGADEERFERERNRLGGMLLLRGRDNESSGAEPYQKKLETYAGTLYWNQSLCGHFYKSKLQTRDFIEETGLDLTPIDVFGPEALEARTEVMFDIVRRLWA